MSDHEDNNRDERRNAKGSRSRERSLSRERDDDKPEKERDASTTSLLVRNLSYRVRPDEIRRVFVRYGEVRDVYIPEDFYTKKPRGFAFVEFYNYRDASDALDNLERSELDGREMSIVFAKDRRKSSDEMRPSRGGRNDSRDRDRGYRGGGGGGGGYDRGGRDYDRGRDSRDYDRGGRDSRDGYRRSSPSRSRSRDRGHRGGGGGGGGRDYRDGGDRDRRRRSVSPPPRKRNDDDDDHPKKRSSPSPSRSPSK